MGQTGKEYNLNRCTQIVAVIYAGGLLDDL